MGVLCLASLAFLALLLCLPTTLISSGYPNTVVVENGPSAGVVVLCLVVAGICGAVSIVAAFFAKHVKLPASACDSKPAA